MSYLSYMSGIGPFRELDILKYPNNQTDKDRNPNQSRNKCSYKIISRPIELIHFVSNGGRDEDSKAAEISSYNFSGSMSMY